MTDALCYFQTASDTFILDNYTAIEFAHDRKLPIRVVGDDQRNALIAACIAADVDVMFDDAPPEVIAVSRIFDEICELDLIEDRREYVLDDLRRAYPELDYLGAILLELMIQNEFRVK